MPDHKRPKMVLAGVNVRDLEDLLRKGFVTAAVMYKPGQKYDPFEEFNDRYMLVDVNNIDQVASEHPEMFPKSK